MKRRRSAATEPAERSGPRSGAPASDAEGESEGPSPSEEKAPPESLTPTRRVEVTRVAGSTVTRTTDVAAAEEPLDVRLHGKSFAVIMRTPGDDKALAAGFLLSERIIRSFDDVGAIEHCKHPDQTKAHHVVDVYLVGGAASRVPGMLEQRRQVIANSSCGVCGRSTIDELRADIEPLAVGPAIDVSVVRQ